MTTRLHVGWSVLGDARAAASKAARDALRDASRPALGLVLVAGGSEPEALAASLGDELGSLPWIGCTATAVFGGGKLIRDGVVCGVIDSDDAYVGVGAGGPLSQGPSASGALAVSRALDQLPAPGVGRCRAIFGFFNPQLADGSEVVRGAMREGGAAAAWTGGGAGHAAGCARAAQFARGRAYREHVVAAILDLPGTVRSGLRHGWKPYGPPTLVSRARGCIVSELEFEPAIEVYRRIARDRGDAFDEAHFEGFAALHPLGVPQGDGEYVLRDPVGLGEGGAIHFLAEVPDGSLVRVMHSSPEELLAAAAAPDELPGAPTDFKGWGGAFVFDCVSRERLLGERFDEELRAIATAIPEGVPWMGCLTAGEIGSHAGGVPQFHNKALSILCLPG